MEGPSLYLAAEQLAPFCGKRIQSISGNTKIGKERMDGLILLSIFPYGKTLFFQFDSFALRVHFLLYGTFEATVDDKSVTGDYPKKVREPRLAISFENGHIEMYNCSVKFVEESDAKSSCDYTIDIMSPEWDEKRAIDQLKQLKNSEICDVLLDQDIFKGVGNIIKNESLLLAGILPTAKVKNIDPKKMARIVRGYVFDFLEWRKNFELRKHYRVYRQSHCKQCGTKVARKVTGKTKRMSYFCPHCQRA